MRLIFTLGMLATLCCTADTTETLTNAGTTDAAGARNLLEAVDGSAGWGSAHAVEPSFRTVRYAEGTQLVLDGMPAISADGRFVVDAAVSHDDWGNGVLQVLSTHTGKVVQEIPWPQTFDFEDGTAGRIDRASVTAVERQLERGDYRALELEPLSARPSDPTSRSVTEWGSPTVTVRSDPPSDAPRRLAIEHQGRLTYVSETVWEFEDVTAVSIDPSGRFIFARLFFCACACSQVPRIYPLR